MRQRFDNNPPRSFHQVIKSYLSAMAPGKPRVQFRVMEGAETLGLRALRREFGLYGEATIWVCMDLGDICYISVFIVFIF